MMRPGVHTVFLKAGIALAALPTVLCLILIRCNDGRDAAGHDSLRPPEAQAAAVHAVESVGHPTSPGDGWAAYGCYWDLRDSVFFAQGYLTTAKAYYAPKTFSSFTFEVRMAKLAEDGAIGLLFRYDEKLDRGYSIQLWPHGGFAVSKFRGPAKEDLLSGPPSHFNREMHTWNTVKVVGAGKRFDIFVNGFPIATVRDAEHRTGKLGLHMPGDARQVAKFQIVTMTGDS